MAASVLRDAGAEVHVRTPDEGPFAHAMRASGFPCDASTFPVVRKVELSGRRLVRLVLGFPLDVWRLRREIRALAPGVVLVNTLATPHWLVAAWLARVPRHCYVHEDERRQPRPVQLVLVAPLLLCQTIIAVSSSVVEFLTRNFGRLQRRTVVVHNASAFPEPLPMPADGPPYRIGLVGRLGRIKAQDVAVDALQLLRDRGLDVRLELVGDVFPGYEHLEHELRARVAAHGLESYVTFAGYRSEPWPHLADAHVIVMPSRSETFGLVAIEAMAAGRPVGASDVGGLREIVRHGEDGFLVPVDDARALADAVEVLLRDHALWERMARAALEVRDRFTPERYAEELTAAVLGGAVSGTC